MKSPIELSIKLKNYGNPLLETKKKGSICNTYVIVIALGLPKLRILLCLSS